MRRLRTCTFIEFVHICDHSKEISRDDRLCYVTETEQWLCHAVNSSRSRPAHRRIANSTESQFCDSRANVTSKPSNSTTAAPPSTLSPTSNGHWSSSSLP